MIDKTEEQFAKINEMFEEFKLNTITKDEFLSGIEDKADKEEIANIVSSYNNRLCTQNCPNSRTIFRPFLGHLDRPVWTVTVHFLSFPLTSI